MKADICKVLAISVIAVFTFDGNALGAQDIPEETVQSAKADYMTYCAVCHGQSGVGDGPVAKDLIGAPPDLTQLAKINGGTFPEDRVHKVIDGRQVLMGHGTRDMPIWGNWFKFIARGENTEDSDEITSEIIVSLRIQSMIEYLKIMQVK